MKNTSLALWLIAIYGLFQTASAQKIVVALGSSTTLGAASSDSRFSWVGRLQSSYRKNLNDGADTVVYALGGYGYSTYKELPTGHIAPIQRETIDVNNNVTAALNLNPDIVIVNLPSNDVKGFAWDFVSPPYNTKETMDNFRLIYQTVIAAGKTCFIATTQPRNDLDPAQRQLQKNLRDSITNTFGVYSINFWDDLVTGDGFFSLRDELRHLGFPDADYHLNDEGHRLLFDRVIAKNIFGGTPPPPPPPPPPPSGSKIEAENYTAMNGIRTETTSDAGGGLNVAWQDNGDWMDYSVNVTTAGTFTINFRVATMFATPQFQLRKADGSILATVNVPNTGGFQNWTTVSAVATLDAGQQTLRIHTTNAAGGWNINWWEIAGATTPPPPPPPPSGSKIEAENYTAMNGIRTETTSDVGGGLNVAWQDNGDWMDYSVNVATAGTYTVNFRVATMFATPQFQLRKADGAVLATVNVPNTGGFQNWTTVSAVATLDAGQQTLRIHTTNAAGGWNINWWEIAGATTPPPPPPPPPPSGSIKIEAENYTAMNGIRTENTSDVGGGLNVAWQDTGDWMDYSVNVATAGTYTVNFRVATMFATPQFQLRKADGGVLATVNVPNTGGFQNWTTVSASATLAAGTQTLRIHTTIAAGGWNINWWEIAGATTPPPPPTTSTKIEAENYTAMNGIRTETTSDAGGGLNVAWQDTGDWMDYSVNVATAGTYTVNFRVATMFATPQFQLRKADGAVLATVNVPNTGGFQNWTTVSASVTLAAGTQTLRIHTTNAAGGWNINWWELNSTSTGATVSADKTFSGDTERSASAVSMQAFPNPVSDRFTLVVNNNFTGSIVLEIINLQGAVAKRSTLTKPAKGVLQFTLHTNGLAVGGYIVRASMRDWTESIRITKN